MQVSANDRATHFFLINFQKFAPQANREAISLIQPIIAILQCTLKPHAEVSNQ